MNQIIHNTPNWLYEAAACISEQYTDHQSSFMEKHEKFGMTRDEMDEYMKKYTLYKDKVFSEIKLIYEKYPSLEKFFHRLDSSNGYHPIAISLVTFFGPNMSSTLKNNEIDRVINKFIPSVIGELPLDIKEDEIVISNIEDVLNLLDSASIEDRDKMQILNLYRNRYEIIRQLAELLHLCAPVCQKHFSIVKEEFEKTIRLLNEADDLEGLIISASGVKMNMPQKSNIYTSIFYFNDLSMIEIDDRLTLFAGIYFFDFADLKSKNKFNDTQIVTDLKALGDPTRLKMIHLLSRNNMYIQELAEKLELTPATVSHHVNILLGSGFISLTVDTQKAKKIYYMINSEKLDSLSKIIKSLADNL